MSDWTARPNDPDNVQDVDAAAVAQRLIDEAERFMQQAGVPFTEWQKRVIASMLNGANRDDVEFELYNDPPVQTCVNLEATSRPFSLGLCDEVLRDIYVPALQAQLNSSHSFSQMIANYRPIRKRVWWKPSTWRRGKKLNGINNLLKQSPKKGQWQSVADCWPDVRVIADETVPPNTAYFINPDYLHVEPVWGDYLPGDDDQLDATLMAYGPYSFKIEGAPDDEENTTISWHVEGDDEVHGL